MVWRLAATVIALGGVAWLVDLPAALAALQGADPVAIAFAILLVQAQVVLSAWRWRLIAARLGVRLAFGPAVAEYYVAGLVNMVLPGGVPGDALRAVRLKLAGEARWGPVVRSVVLERAAGQAALAAVTVAGFAAWPLVLGSRVPVDAVWLGVGVVAAGAALIGLLALGGRLGPAALRSALAGFGADARTTLVSRGAWLGQGVLNLAIVASYIAAFAFAAAALGHPLPPTALVTVVPVVLLSMVVPVTIGGWGVREGVAAGLWPLLGLDPALGFATSMLYGLIVLVGSLPGAAFLVRRGCGSAR